MFDVHQKKNTFKICFQGFAFSLATLLVRLKDQASLKVVTISISEFKRKNYAASEICFRKLKLCEILGTGFSNLVQ